MTYEKPTRGLTWILWGFWITSFGVVLFALRPFVQERFDSLLSYTAWTYFGGTLLTLIGQIGCAQFPPCAAERPKIITAIWINVFSLATFFVLRNTEIAGWLIALMLFRWFLSCIGYYLFLSYMHPFAKSLNATLAELHLKRSLFWYRLVLLKITALIGLNVLDYFAEVEWAREFLAALHDPKLFFGDLPFAEIIIRYARIAAVVKLGLVVISIIAFTYIVLEMRRVLKRM